MDLSEVHPPGHDPFDPEFMEDVGREIFGHVIENWFRPRLLRAHRLPKRGPLVLAANHSGSAFPYDGMVLDMLLWRRDGFCRRSKLRSVYEKKLALNWWMRPFGLDNFWRKGGGVDMTFDNFDRLLARGERVAYYPEGVPGIGKGFGRRYRLQRFSTSFVILAARYRAPVSPVYVINAEWVIPFNYTFKPIDRLFQRFFGVPFLPLPGAIFAIVFPWAWYLALPARMIFVVGDPIDVRALVDATGETDLDRPDRERMRRVAEQIRGQMQPELDRLVRRYGRRPYQLRSLRRGLARARRRRELLRTLPWGWPPAFIRADRDEHRGPARNFLHRWLRDWDLIGFYLPLGWPLLSLARRFRKPPCGYRGLTAEERRAKEGAYIWHLSERPLP